MGRRDRSDRPVFWPVGQNLTRHWRNFGLFLALAVAIAAAVALGLRQSSSSPQTVARPTGIPAGGDLVISVRTEPVSFNRHRSRDSSTDLVSILTQAKLVRINRSTQELEPWLAESWTRSADGLRYTLKLRPNVTFSDGHPFSADDVLFSFAVAYDPRTASSLVDALKANGRALEVAATDPLTVVVTFPQPFGPGVRILDNLPIFPRHKLAAAQTAGTFATAWGLQTPVSDIVGLGPFVLAEYVPGQRIVFTRNPHFFMKDASGAALPHLARVIVEVNPDQNAQLLRLDAGQIDMTDAEMRPEDYAPLKRAADAGRVQLLDLGVAYDADSLWINLKPGAFANDPRAAWLQRDELRQAISLAVDRKVFADTVYLGSGVPVYGPITPANKKWYSADLLRPAYDPARAKTLLASIGLTDHHGDGLLEDARNQPVHFTLLTQKGRTALERGSMVIHDELKKIGVTVDVVPLDAGALISRFLSGANYDAVYFTVATTDTDPAINPDFWFSSGTARVWNLAQKTPATDWERRIDALMTRQIASPDEAERKRLFDEVQKIFAEHLPTIQFVAPRLYAAASTRVTNLRPSLIRPQLLWAPESVAVMAASHATQ
jgi:peptide/nickel transport system substrate-binding protein